MRTTAFLPLVGGIAPPHAEGMNLDAVKRLLTGNPRYPAYRTGNADRDRTRAAVERNAIRSWTRH